MTLRTILLVAPAEVSRPDCGPSAFAAALAAMAGAKLTIFCVALDVTSPGQTADAVGVAERLRASAEAQGVEAVVVSDHSHAIGVHEVVAEHARLHDISIAGTDGRGLLSERQLAEYLMFESGRPVLLVPHDWHGEVVIDKLCIAWDNSRAAARALGDAALLGMREAVFLSVTDDKPLSTDLAPADIVRAANRAGMAATFVTTSLNGRSIGDALQAEAAARGAAVLAMGAFGHSRLRRFVLGSATSGIMAGLRMPVLLSH